MSCGYLTIVVVVVVVVVVLGPWRFGGMSDESVGFWVVGSCFGCSVLLRFGFGMGKSLLGTFGCWISGRGGMLWS